MALWVGTLQQHCNAFSGHIPNNR